MQHENIVLKKVESTSLQITIGPVVFLKMFLRGIFNLSFLIKLYSVMNQTAIGQRNGVRLPNGDRIIAVRKSSHEAEIISACNEYRKDENIGKRAAALANSLFKISLAGPNIDLTAQSISTVKQKEAA